MRDLIQERLLAFNLSHGALMNGNMRKEEFKPRHSGLGIYEQRQDGLYMVRTRMPGGCVTPGQLLTVARLAAAHGSGRLHISTRQELQLHEIPLSAVPVVAAALTEAGLSPCGGGGNTVRNILVSEWSGIRPGNRPDLAPMAEALTRRILQEESSYSLPRKFKIAFSHEDEPDAARWQDLGFVTCRRNGEQGFAVFAGGGLGRKPRVGIELEPFIEPDKVYETALAVKQLFHRLGNREDRTSARLRFVLDRLGPEGFRSEYRTELDRVRKAGVPPLSPELPAAPVMRPSPVPAPDLEEDGFQRFFFRSVAEQPEAGYFTVALPVLYGDISAVVLERLGNLLEPFGPACIRLTQDQNIRLRNIPGNEVRKLFIRLGSDFPQLREGVLFMNAVACSGAGTCRLGITRPREALFAVMKAVRESGAGTDKLGAVRMRFSGCPNACGAHPGADLGFYGRRGVGENPGNIYRVFAGAERVNEPAALACELGEVPEERLPEFVVRALAMAGESQSPPDWTSAVLHDRLRGLIADITVGEKGTE